MMKPHVGWILGAGLMFVAFAAPASAQVSVDVGVFSPNVGARVVIGGPRVVYVPVERYRTPVYSRHLVYPRYPRRVIYPQRDRYYYGDRKWDGRGRLNSRYYRDVREARREYQRDLREARRDYERDVREAARRRWR